MARARLRLELAAAPGSSPSGARVAEPKDEDERKALLLFIRALTSRLHIVRANARSNDAARVTFELESSAPRGGDVCVRPMNEMLDLVRRADRIVKRALVSSIHRFGREVRRYDTSVLATNTRELGVRAIEIK